MAQLKNCILCGKFFEVISFHEMCPSCKEKDDKDYLSIRDYLFLHPCAKIFEVSTNLKISINTIKRYLKEDRLQIMEKDNKFLKCEACGRPICSGMYCGDCMPASKSNLKGIYTWSNLPTEPKINFYTKDEKISRVSYR